MSSAFFTSYLAIWILVLFQGLLVLALLRELAELRRRLELGAFENDDRLPVGSEAPDFTGLDARSGQLVGLQALSGTGGAVLFLTPECNVCKSLANTLRGPAMKDLPPIIVFCQGGERACARFFERLDPKVHLLRNDAEQIAARYHVSGSPTVVLIDGDQKIRGYGHPQELSDLKRMLNRTLGAKSAAAEVENDSHPAILRSTLAQ